MPPRFRITRATAQPKVTIYTSAADLHVDNGPDGVRDTGGSVMARPIAASSMHGPSVSSSSSITSPATLPAPDLEDIVPAPIAIFDDDSTASSSTAPMPITPRSDMAEYTSLRRTTRSATRPAPTAAPIKVEEVEPINPVTMDAAPPATPVRPRKRVKREPVTPVDQQVKVDPLTPGSQPRSAKKVLPLPALEKAHPAPLKWEEQYRLIERMRKGIVAPVDDMGCERPQLGNTTPKMARFHVLISLMLSSQTKDAITSQAVTNLHITLPDGLSAESLAAAPPDVVSGCINKVGFWRRKTEYIQDAARLCLDKHDGDVPNTIEGLCDIRGVGPKMAYLALQCAWEINAGIGVDVHVHRITNRLKWHKPPTQTPEQTRVNLESWLPSRLHRAINPLLVGFGQVICLPIGPRCDLCLLAPAKLCPSRVSNVKAEGRKEVVYTFTADDGEIKGEVAAAKVEVGYEPSSGVQAGQAPLGVVATGEVVRVKEEI